MNIMLDLEEAVDRICLKNRCDKPDQFRKFVTQHLAYRYLGRSITMCGDCCKKYKREKIINANELYDYCLSVNWRFSDEEIPDHEKQTPQNLSPDPIL